VRQIRRPIPEHNSVVLSACLSSKDIEHESIYFLQKDTGNTTDLFLRSALKPTKLTMIGINLTMPILRFGIFYKVESVRN